MKTLLLIGMQTDLMPGGAREVLGSAALLPKVNRLLAHYEHSVAAKFSLPASHLSFAANHPWRKPGQYVQVESQPTELQTMYCVKGSFGAEFAPGINTKNISLTFEMGSEDDGIPHSAFFDAGNPKSTGLREHLKSIRCTELFIAGMPLETIVTNTVQDAIGLGLRVVVLEDACAATEAGIKPAILEKIAAAGGQLATSQ
ncbi:MAG: isochorismatase family protein [Saprospiraceae bacterium]